MWSRARFISVAEPEDCSATCAMFEASVAKFSRAVGRDVYVPVPSLASSENCQLTQVVVKKKSKWFFVRDQYTPTGLLLRDILVDGGSFDVPPDKPADLVTYNKTSVVKISGQFAASFKETFDAELDGVDSISLDANFGLVERQEIPMAPLLSALAKRTINMQHELLLEISNKKRRSLCVIVGVAQTAQISQLHAKLNFDIKASAKVLSSTVVNSDEVSSNCERTLAVPAGTTLAYQIAELKVGKSGEITVILTKDGAGGFSTVIDHVDSRTEGEQDQLQHDAARALQGFSTMSRDGRLSLGAALHHVLQDFSSLLQLDSALKEALAVGSVSADDEKLQSGSGSVSIVLRLLAVAARAAGPQQHSAAELLHATRSITRSSLELSDRAREVLQQCDLGDSALSKRLLAALSKAAVDLHTSRGTDVEDLLTNAAAADECHTAQAKECSGLEVVALSELQAAYIVVAGLFVYLR